MSGGNWKKIAAWPDGEGREISIATNADAGLVRLTTDSPQLRHDIDVPAAVAADIAEKMLRAADGLSRALARTRPVGK